MSDHVDFLGSGWKFPPQLDSRGRTALVHDVVDVEEAIKIVLLTRKGERPMRPEFGSDLFRLVFMPNNASTCGLARRYVKESLDRWEPRIEVMEVTVEPDRRNPSRMVIQIEYRIPAINSERNLVFPFYTIPGEE